MKALAAHGFSGKIDSQPTYPAESPERPIDFILAPPGWALLEHRVIQDSASDHCAVFARFGLAGTPQID
jgi:endonuclease/exonuclease/phosphatase (EEP) superfamily protein YafD